MQELASRRTIVHRDGSAGLRVLTLPAPLDEGFEAPAFPPPGWSLLNPDSGSITWERADGAGGSGASASSAWMDFYDYEFDMGDVDELRTPVITGLLAGDSLFVEYAYAEYDDPFFGPDSLLIRVSLNGGATFPVTLFADGGSTLATAAPTDLPYVPAASDWRTLRLRLPPGVAGAGVVVSFTAVNGYSNNLYLDNVFIGSLPANDIAAASVLSPPDGSKQRTPFSPQALVLNRGTAAQNTIPVRCRITGPTGALVYDQTTTVPSLAPSASASVTFPLFVLPGDPGAYAVLVTVSNPGDGNPGNDSARSGFYRPGLLSGTFTVGQGGQIPTLRAMADTLNRSDVAGPLTFRLISPVYAETGPVEIRDLEGAGPFAPVLITPSPGLVVSVTAPGTPDSPFALGIFGSTDVTVDGTAGGEEAAASLSITATGVDGAVGVYIGGTEGRSASRCTLRSIAVRTAADSLSSSGGFYGILVSGTDEAQRDSGVLIERCTVTRHGQAGIAAQNTYALRISRCTIGGWTQRDGFTDLRGIWLAGAADATTVEATTVDAIENRVAGWWAFGIQNSAGAGSAFRCVNTTVSRVRSVGAGSDQNLAAGIWLSGITNTGDRILHCSVSLDGRDSSTFGFSRSSGIEIAAGVSDLRIRNTIVRNATEHAGGGPASRAFAVYTPASTWAPGDTSDANDLYVAGPQGAVGYFNGAVRTTLADWRAATGQDAGSMSVDPLFAGPGNLHIAIGTSPVGNAGVPLSEVPADLDGELRDPVTPDMGADEFAGNSITVPVALQEGWNMISSPVDRAAGADSVGMLFPSALLSYAFAFSPVSGYRQDRVLAPGAGYWEKFGAAGTEYVGGGLRAADSIQVQAGWNMVGGISFAVDTATVVSVPPGIRSSHWFAYNGSYSAATTLAPGRAYWVKSAAAGLFILMSPAASAKGRALRESPGGSD